MIKKTKISNVSSLIVTDLFQCLSCPYRLQCVLLINQYNRLCVCDFMQILNLSQPKVSRYLSDLRKCGILTGEKKAQWVYYQFTNTLPVYFFELINLLSKSTLEGLPELSLLNEQLTCDTE